jgi:Zn-dependent M28 family amino/carboxypeptidase
VVLILAIPAFADIALSSIVPGASDNASGVATALRLAERYGGDLEHFDVWVLLTGGEEAFGEGMREWMRRHRRALDSTRTVFLNIDTVGSGTVRYTRREGALVPTRHHPRLLELCRQIAEEDADEGRYGARPVTGRGLADSLAARRAGFPAITISCRAPSDHAPNLHRHTDVPAAVEDAALDRAFRFCSELIELIDEEIGPDVAQQGARAGGRRLSGLSSSF